MFHIGQEVECIDDSPAWGIVPSRLVKNRTYTIEALYLGIYIIISVKSPHDSGSWQPLRFRPIHRTDISIFTAMLTKAPELV